MAVLDRKLGRDARALLGQLIAVALVVACGIATWVTMRGAYASLLLTRNAYYREYRFADIFCPLKRAPDALAARIAHWPGVTAVEARVVEDVNLSVPGLAEPATARLISLPAQGAPRLNALYLRAGRLPEPGRADEVAASEAFAAANHLRPGASLAAVLHGKWQSLRVTGIVLSPEYVYEIRGGDIFPDNRRFAVLWMRRPALAAAFRMEGAFNDLSLALAPGVAPQPVIARLDRQLEPWGGLGAYARADQISNRFLSDEIAQDRVTGTWVPLIFLAVAALLVDMVLTRLVLMQRGQIAILKAFGYGSGTLAAHYVKLALLPALAGTALGIGVGAWFAHGLTRIYAGFFRLPLLRFRLEPAALLLAAGIGLAAGAVGALLAVRRAVALAPAEAMRPEAPARFRPGLLERLGLAGWLPLNARMVARNLQRRPGKSALNLLAVASAAALLVVCGYFLDAVNYFIALQFQQVQREDVTVSFERPLSAAAVHDLFHLPGVGRVEPFRAVPVRLRFAHRDYRTVLLGQAAGGEMRRVFDANRRVLPLPGSGLLLGDALAERLGVHTGDVVRVEVLEGRRPVWRERVARTVYEMLGMRATMDSAALGRRLGEPGVASGAYLKVDARAAPALYAQLKRNPVINAVTVPAVELAGFRETMAQSLWISTFVLGLFAAIIAVGVIYNGGRIALSERGRELASLRVLGFTRAEVTRLLLGEQALLTAAAIPLGWLAGFGWCALLVLTLRNDTFRLPLVVSRATLAFAAAVVAAAAAASALFLRSRIRHLDLIEVLKSRE